MTLGVVVMVAGFGSSLTELLGAAASDGGLFTGECKLHYAYSPASPLDPCNVSGLPPFDDV